jgi:putative intracellular protease/amidase
VAWARAALPDRPDILERTNCVGRIKDIVDDDGPISQICRAVLAVANGRVFDPAALRRSV